MSEPLDYSSGMSRHELDEKFRNLDSRFDGYMARHQADMERLHKGAEASVLTSFQLNGNIDVGIKGFIPQTLERLTALEAQGAERDKAIGVLDQKADELEKSQISVQKTLNYIAKFFHALGKIADWKVWALGVVAGAIYLFPTLRHSHFVNLIEKFLHGAK